VSVKKNGYSPNELSQIEDHERVNKTKWLSERRKR
jgi:hypothetical protein